MYAPTPILDCLCNELGERLLAFHCQPLSSKLQRVAIVAMGTSSPYQPHKLVIACLYGASRTFADVRRLVETRFGPVDDVLPAREFTFSSYYEPEMGPGLMRTLFSFESLVDPSTLASYKQAANSIEQEIPGSPGGHADAQPGRTINLDPGLLSLSRVILATTKASAHRVPLRDGLFAEITLIYRHGRYRPLEWTYPDYRSDAFVEWLARVRATYHEQLRRLDPARPWRL